MTTLETVGVGEIERSEAVGLFFKYSKIKPNRPDVHTDVGRIIGELGHLTLAITLAGFVHGDDTATMFSIYRSTVCSERRC